MPAARHIMLRNDTNPCCIEDLRFNECWWLSLSAKSQGRALEQEGNAQKNFLRCFHFYAYEVGEELPYEYIHIWYTGRKKRWKRDKKIFDCVIQEMKEEDEFSGVPLPN
jgi:hypothetical protein